MAEKQKIVRAYIKKLAVTTAAQVLVKENPDRHGLLVVVTGSDTAYILSAQNQVAADGIPITATTPYSNDYLQGPLWILTASGTANARVEEDSLI
jgi:hypothetical protein